MLGERSFKFTTHRVETARKTLGWTFHGSRYCQLIWNANKERGCSGQRTTCTVLLTKPLPKHPFMLWAGISKKGTTNICLLGCSMNSAVYQEVLRTHLLPLLRERLPNGRFRQDNAPCHTSKATQVFPSKQD